MERIVLLGSNIAHSRSPDFHNRLFEKYDLPFRYELMPTTAEELLGAIERMKEGGYRGANVTSPYKELAFTLMDEASDTSKRLGSVNTILFEGGKAIGFNTDVDGFRESLLDEPLLERSFSAAVLGTGGAARAAVEVLLENSHLLSLSLYSRSEERSAEVIARWGDQRLSSASLANFTPPNFVVHATPVGLPGVPSRLLEPEELRGVELLYEMIYSPEVTELIRAATEAGVRVIGGAEMFEAQAMAAFHIWTEVSL
ncbi:MAG: shikimate dehydrogenase [Ignavibacteriae bacterium]|nr:shikimate dehydrogenase [Ignavibacteriota bacterium]MCB9216557.1 shikimate dehydrogenase [Ignavibacteria bacterium]